MLYVAAMQDEDEAPAFITEVTEGGGVDMTTVVLGAERLAKAGQMGAGQASVEARA